ncbi:hypothetical protein RhiirA5_383813 [Rhizophagus irregularis]|uniref:Uncharacterized protein n=1 Tax=Rhizophagus irregularis TaxID=588596 RepID=A0A2N0NVL1_9GLOM|nr:hypothetical protein RhiirA5_383813 [Rhizophagus irregularis]
MAAFKACHIRSREREEKSKQELYCLSKYTPRESSTSAVKLFHCSTEVETRLGQNSQARTEVKNSCKNLGKQPLAKKGQEQENQIQFKTKNQLFEHVYEEDYEAIYQHHHGDEKRLNRPNRT